MRRNRYRLRHGHGLFEESMAMTKEDFINELSSKTLTTSVFGDAQQEYPDDNTTEVQETDD